MKAAILCTICYNLFVQRQHLIIGLRFLYSINLYTGGDEAPPPPSKVYQKVSNCWVTCTPFMYLDLLMLWLVFYFIFKLVILLIVHATCWNFEKVCFVEYYTTFIKFKDIEIKISLRINTRKKKIIIEGLIFTITSYQLYNNRIIAY